MQVLTMTTLFVLALACGGRSTGPAGAPASAPESPSTPTDPSGSPSTSEPVPFETVAEGSVPAAGGPQVREVIRDEAAWGAAWAGLSRGVGTDPPPVDFGKDMVILAAMETQSCVSKVTIRGITRSSEGLVVDLLEEPPAPSCICITTSRPYHAVRLARTDAPVRFEAELGRTEC